MAAGAKVWETRLPGPIRSVAVADDGRHIFTDNNNGTVYVLRVPDLLTRPAPADYSVDPVAERKAAEWLASFPGERCIVTTNDGQGVTVDSKLPEGPFFVQWVYLGRLDLDDPALANLGRCRRITSLTLEINPRLTDAGLRHLSHLASLEGLDVRNTGIGDGLAELLRRSPNLQRLQLHQSKVTNALLPALADCPRLCLLTLPGAPAPIDLSDVATYCPRLKELTIPTGSRISSPDGLCRMANLEKLDCEGAFLAGQAREGLGALSRLSRFVIHSPSDAAVARLALLGGRVQRLWLGHRDDPDAELTSAGYRTLGKLHALEHLTIGEPSGSPTDDDLLALTELPKLRELRIAFPADERKYTPEGIDAFVKQRPDIDLAIDGRPYPPTAE